MNNIIILVLGIANIVVVSYVTYLHFKVSLHSHPLKEILLKVKTTILLLVLLFEILVVIRYSLDFADRKLYMVILTFHQFLSSIIFFQICYFYAKKAVHYIPDGKQTLLVMRIVLYCSLAVFVGFIIWQYLT